jgi:hypothetical protein
VVDYILLRILLLYCKLYHHNFTEIRYSWTIPIRYRFDTDSMNRIYVVKLVFTASIRYRLVARSLRYRICIESMSIKTTFRRCNRNVVTSNRHRVNILKNRVLKLIRRCNRNVATSNRHGVNILKNRWFDVVIATWRHRIVMVNILKNRWFDVVIVTWRHRIDMV